MPFALSESEMRHSSVAVEGLLLDRHRLLEPGADQQNWVTPNLRHRLIDWLQPRVAALPYSNAMI
jgi:hypothetical protein